jgi:uncharacterized protein
MGLEMRKECERCSAPLGLIDTAFICVYECTFCQDCTEDMNKICPNCGGELVRRPRKSSAG